MKSAIIVGGNGLIGRALVEELIKEEISILILGSSKEMHENIKKIKNSKIEYYQIKNQKFWLEETIKDIKKKIVPEECVFFNLAWRGKTGLVDGGIEDQLGNVSLSCELVKLTQQLGIKKYVATGSMEELKFKRYVEGDYWLNPNESIKANWYALSKVSALMQSSFEAYHDKIDFCYVRISVVIDINLNTNKFVENSLKSLLKTSKTNVPKTNELCNISSSSEIGKQLIEIGKSGLNKRIYTLGTGDSASLGDYFNKFAKMAHPQLNIPESNSKSEISLLKKEDFDTKYLTLDTGYEPKETSEILFNRLIRTS